MAVKGVPQTPEHRKKIGDAQRGPQNHAWGKRLSPEHRAKLSASHRGERHHLWGKHHSAETRLKISASRTGQMRGPQNPQWRGGCNNAPYPWMFNAELRTEVRRRDGNKCCLCGVPQQETKWTLRVHHIDYDKNNSDPVNLIALCNSCHGRTSHNRDHWKAVFRARAVRLAS